jgi:hypothetical protein
VKHLPHLFVSCFLASRLALATQPIPPHPLDELRARLDRTLAQGRAAQDLTFLQGELSAYATSELIEFRAAALDWLVKHDACFTTEEAKPLFGAFRAAGVAAPLSSAVDKAEAGRAQRALEAQDRRAWLRSLTELPASVLPTRISNRETQQRLLGAARAACGSPCTDECYLVWLVTSRINLASRSASSGIGAELFEQLYRLSRMSAR